MKYLLLVAKSASPRHRVVREMKSNKMLLLAELECVLLQLFEMKLLSDQ